MGELLSPDAAADRTSRRRRATLALHVIAAAAPAAIVLALIAGRLAASPAQFVPWWNDEVVYWNETAAFVRAGFDGGYVTVDERAPRATFSRFGPHGPVFPVLYGTIGRAAGWQPYSAFFINLVLVTAAAFVWLRIRRPGRWTELALPAVFWPLLLLLPTNMQEPMHFAVAFLLAAATWRLLEGGSATRTWLWAGPVLAVAALARPTWALMLLPIGWVQLRNARPRARMLPAAGSAAAFVLAQQAFAYMAAPYPGSVVYLSAGGPGSGMDLAAAAVGMWNRFRATLGPYLDSENGDPSEVALRYVAVAFVAVLVIAALRARERAGAAVQAAAAALVLPLALILATGYIEGFRDFRILAPHLLYAVLLASAVAMPVRAAWWLTLLAASTYVQSFADLHRERFTVGTAEIRDVKAAIAPVITYDAEGAGWGNTVLVHAELLKYPLLGLPHGLSLSYVLDWDDQTLPFRSRYLLLRRVDLEALEGRGAPLTPLAATPVGTLYRNRDAK